MGERPEWWLGSRLGEEDCARLFWLRLVLGRLRTLPPFLPTKGDLVTAYLSRGYTDSCKSVLLYWV